MATKILYAHIHGNFSKMQSEIMIIIMIITTIIIIGNVPQKLNVLWAQG